MFDGRRLSAPTGKAGAGLRRIRSSAANWTLDLPDVITTKRYICDVNAMNKIITQRELRNDFAAVLREVQAGQTLIVTRNGAPVAELRPVHRRRFVPRAVLVEAAARAPQIDARRFRADPDAVIDQSLDD